MARTIVAQPRVTSTVLHAHPVQGRYYDKTRFEETPDSYFDPDLLQWFGLQEIKNNPHLMDAFEFMVWLDQASIHDLERFASTTS